MDCDTTPTIHGVKAAGMMIIIVVVVIFGPRQPAVGFLYLYLLANRGGATASCRILFGASWRRKITVLFFRLNEIMLNFVVLCVGVCVYTTSYEFVFCHWRRPR